MPNFPTDLLEPNDTLPIFVTAPVPSNQYNNYTSMPYSTGNSSLTSLSPNSSPTTADFPSHPHAHTLSRTHSLQHLNYGDAYGQTITTRYDATGMSLTQSSALDPFDTDSDHGRKRQRTGPPTLAPQGVSNAAADASGVKRMSRARSDSAPLGYGIGQPWAHGNRPRSGTGVGLRGNRREDYVPTSSNVLGPGRGALGTVPPMLALVPPQKTPPHN